VTPESLELDYLRSVVRRPVDRPCAFSRRDTGVDEFARVTWQMRRLDGWRLRLLAEEIDRLLTHGFLCEVCGWKVRIFAARWLELRLPIRAADYRREVPGRSALVFAGRDIQSEIEQALANYPWPL
jgi:hypothetical protein